MDGACGVRIGRRMYVLCTISEIGPFPFLFFSFLFFSLLRYIEKRRIREGA